MAHPNLHLHIPQGNVSPVQSFSPASISPSAGSGPSQRRYGPSPQGLTPGMRQLQHIQSQLHAAQAGGQQGPAVSPINMAPPGGRRPGPPGRLGLNALSAAFVPGGNPAAMLSPGVAGPGTSPGAMGVSPGSMPTSGGHPNMAIPAMGMGPGFGMPMSISPSALSGAGSMPPTPLTGMSIFQNAQHSGLGGGGGLASGASTPSVSGPPGRIGGVSPIPTSGGAAMSAAHAANGLPGSGAGAPQLGAGGPLMGVGLGGRPTRKPRGLPQHTPLKTTGHNSKPSVSLNAPALLHLLSSVQGAAPKKRTVVCLPSEVDEAARDEAAAQLAELEPGEDGNTEASLTAEERIARNKARDAAAVRCRWPIRQPLQLDAAQATAATQAYEETMLADENVVSAPIFPEPWPYENGLPETIDIYMPGKGAWDIYREQRIRERIEAAEEQRLAAGYRTGGGDGGDGLGLSRSASQNGHGLIGAWAEEVGDSSYDANREPAWGVYGPPGGIGGGQNNNETDGRSRALSISSPADHNMVSFKLNRYLQSQAEAQAAGADAEGQPSSSAMDPRRGSTAAYSDSAHDPNARLRLPQYESYTRSTSGPGSYAGGGNHASAASIAVPPAMGRSSSDRGGAMGFDALGRPELVPRVGGSETGHHSHPQAHPQPGSSSFTRVDSGGVGGAPGGAGGAHGDVSASLEQDDSATAGLASTAGLGAGMLEGLVSADTTADSLALGERGGGGGREKEDTKQPAAAPNWKVLARGFGYDLPEVDEEAESVRSRRNGAALRHGKGQPGEHDEDEEDLDKADLRTNPSEDADDSDVEEDEDEYAGKDGAHHRRQMSQPSERHWARRSAAQISDFGARGGGATASGHARASVRGSNDISGVSLSELDHVSRPLPHLQHQHRGDAGDDMDEEEQEYLSDVTTEGASDEVYSNPSDEEAAQIRREERRERRARRRISRGLDPDPVGRNGGGGGALGRPRSGTVNTLPSSSFGEGDDYDQRRDRGGAPRVRPPGFPGTGSAGGGARGANDEYGVLSNPSEEGDDDDRYSHGADTFGGRGPLDHPLDPTIDDIPQGAGAALTGFGQGQGHIGRMSEDFKFPHGGVGAGGFGRPAQGISPYQTQAYHESSGPSMRFGAGGTLGRSAGNAMLNPAAKEFSFGGVSSAAAASNAAGSQSGRTSLNAAAPSFTPGKFTFTAPGVAKVTIPDPVMPARPLGEDAVAAAASARDAQGREKRPRFVRNALQQDEGEFSFQHSEDAFDPTLSLTPQRPRNSTASIEGPLRNLADGTAVRPFGSAASIHAPVSVAQGGRVQAPEADTSGGEIPLLHAHAPPFRPTWGRSTALGPASRPAIPHFGGIPPSADRPTPLIFGEGGAAVLPTVPASEFTFTVGNKAIPIRKPDEVAAAATQDGSAHSRDASFTGPEGEDGQRRQRQRRGERDAMPDVPRDMESEHEQENERRGSRSTYSQQHHAGGATNNSVRVPLSSVYDDDSDDAKAAAAALVSASAVAAAKQKQGRSAPMPIPMVRPDQAGQSQQQQASASGLSRSFRGAHGRNGTAESLAHSLTSGRALRHRRASTVDVGDEDGLSLDERDEMRRSRRRSGARDDDDDGEEEDESDDDEDAVSDIIEELGERIEKALDGWAGKILDEVTIMGQVRPVLGAKLDAAEREALLQSFGVRVEEQLQEHFARFKEATAAQTAAAAAAAATSSTSKTDADTDGEGTTRPAHPSRTGSGHAPLDAQGELDFDYVSDTLDHKIAELKKELTAVFESTLPKAMESVVEKMPTPAAVATVPSAGQAATAMDLSLKSSQELADQLLRRLQTTLEATQSSTTEQLEATLEKVLEPLLEDGFARAQVKSVVDRTEATHQLTELITAKFGELEHAMGESKTSIGDQLQVALINGIVPHIETLRQEPIDPDVVAARVLEILAPMLEGKREQDREAAMSRKSSEDSRGPHPRQTEDIADTTVERMLPFLNALKPAHLDAEEIGSMIEVALSKKHISAEADLEPVIALLEPLVAKQEESRGLSRQTIDRLKEVESTMAVLPGAINAKTEIFLTATQQTHDAQTSILERINELANQFQSTVNRTAELDEQRDELIRQLDEARRESNERKAEADEAKAELSAANGYGSTLKDELTRLEARLDQAEKASEEVTEQMEELRTRAQQAREREHNAERRADQMTAQAREAQHAADAAQAQNLLLQKRLEELSTELAEARAERNRQREAAAQATADVIARAERAEIAAEEARQRADARSDEAARIERHAHEQMTAVAERAAKAEGEVLALEKRVAEQDAKIGNLQQLTATQKQKAAQSQQKLAESDKKMQHFEQQAQDLAIANARLAEMEARLADKEAVEDRLASSQDAEMRLREELSTYHSRFLDLEKDLITMKESMVGRDELEAVQAELAASREEVARLNGQLAEREQQTAAALAAAREQQQQQQSSGWAQGQQQANLNTWNSIHAPRSQHTAPDSAQHYANEASTPTAKRHFSTYADQAPGGAGANNHAWGDSDSSSDSHAHTGQSAYSSYAHIGPSHSSSFKAAHTPSARSVSGRSLSPVAVRVVRRDEGGWWS